MIDNTISIETKKAAVFAMVEGEPLTDCPRDLYIPPEALRVFLEAFEGPLDLLLYLIRRQNLDILNIPMVQVTRQYMAYVEMIKSCYVDLAGDYLVMAATLAEIKSRFLLPKVVDETEQDIDPRAELMNRLQAYEQFKQAALDLDEMARAGRDFFSAQATVAESEYARPQPSVSMQELLAALKDVMARAVLLEKHMVTNEPLSVRERMAQIVSQLSHDTYVNFVHLFDKAEGEKGVIVTFLALLELLKSAIVDIVQTAPFAPIHVKAL